jgi:hypothetical protein
MALATVAARDAYLARKAVRPSPEALISGFKGNMLDLALEIVRRMREGDPAAIKWGGGKVEPVIRPDGLFHLGTICLDTAVTLAKDAGLVADELDFGDIHGRRIRE